MSTMVTDTQTTIERWTADPHRTTIEFEVDHLWVFTPFAAASAASKASTSWARTARRSS